MIQNKDLSEGIIAQKGTLTTEISLKTGVRCTYRWIVKS